ncbi:putative aspartate aminotransferase, cytoplasmic 2 isoform X2 [Polyodon spathula]|nr:putative aspartate aminotransferase, cytoplasmic 2 isoform X2 [Polyodon spathula]
MTRKVMLQICSDPTLTLDYLPTLGLPEFTRSATELALGRDSPAIRENRAGGVQTLGGTGAIRLGAELLQCWYNVGGARCGPVYLSSPSGGSVAATLQGAGIRDIRSYRYWHPDKKDFAVEPLLQDLEDAPEQSVIVLYASAHCPTGAEPSHSDWKQIAEVMMRRRLFPFFLLPSQGLCWGDPAQDAWSLRYFVSLGFELLCAQSFSTNFGLYSDRVGSLLLVLKQSSLLLAVQSQAASLVRALWSRPPGGGARLVTTVLNNPALLAEWKEGLRVMVERGMLIREKLKERLRMLGIPGFWDHVTQQRGLYCCTGLTEEQVEFLVTRCHVYLPASGCVNVTAISDRTLDHVAESIYLAVTSDPARLQTLTF